MAMGINVYTVYRLVMRNARVTFLFFWDDKLFVDTNWSKQMVETGRQSGGMEHF